MNSSEVFLMGPVSNIGITPMGRSNPSTTSCPKSEGGALFSIKK
ncbi:hypothetical protein [Parageobacillus toebii]